MKLIISGGGTGGHVYPALAVVQELRRLVEPGESSAQPVAQEMLWIGSVGGMEEALVGRAGLKIELISAMGLRGKNPAAALGSLWMMGQGYRQSRKILGHFQPQVLFVTGGYVCAPVTLAARRAGIPVIIYLPDIEPGLAIKFLARFADRVAISTPDSQRFFRAGQTVVTGYPVRPELLAEVEKGQATARHRLGLDSDLPVLMVFGGSRGARSINRAVTNKLETYLEVSQVVHITGSLDEAWVQARRAKLPQELQRRYMVSDYLHEQMPVALIAADLVISRAGASVLGEFPVAGLPAVLIPYPYAGAHQAANAAYLTRHQAAITIQDADLNQMLADVVINLITNQEKLQAMGRASRSLAKPDAAARLAQQIVEVGRYAN